MEKSHYTENSRNKMAANVRGKYALRGRTSQDDLVLVQTEYDSEVDEEEEVDEDDLPLIN